MTVFYHRILRIIVSETAKQPKSAFEGRVRRKNFSPSADKDLVLVSVTNVTVAR
jgi:hypothetical protein